MKRVTLKKRELSYARAEELNTLRTNIQFSGVDKKIIAVTSCLSGEGKSTITYQLAGSLAELGKRVLLIDADMRKSVLVNILENGNVDKGLSHYLSGQCSLSEAVYATDISRLHILFAGPTPPNPTELLSGELFRDTLESFRDIYDYILIDCPPQLSILTINALSCADGVVIPVKTDYLAYRGLTQLQDSIQEIQELINPELKVLGVIATLYDTRVGDDHDILDLLQKEYNLLGVIKRLAVAKKGIYDGLAAVEQAPSSELAKEYVAIANMIMSGREKREEQEHE